MASWVFCNGCFQPPGRASRFSLTSCGHVYCEGCLSRDGPRDPGAVCGHRRPVQEVLQGDLPDSQGPGCPSTRPGHKATAKQGHGPTSLHIPRGLSGQVPGTQKLR
ncbi:unnamed protein product [Pipistrellus nathusii]|uniref:RING-type domain-containing protein n=1 Tax=Pipistrellus nathusii TaxID=59473 RepID=A0ABN9Z4U0_PIPNA